MSKSNIQGTEHRSHQGTEHRSHQGTEHRSLQGTEHRSLQGTEHRSLQGTEHRSVPCRESSLHRSLKFRYSGSGGETETLAGSYVCDGRTSEGELIEVQTGSFGPLKEKVKKLTKTGKLRIIHPIIVQKYIELYDVKGRLLHRRKSPRKGSSWDLFNALIYGPELPLLKNLSIELALIDIIEKRIDDGKGSWRRKGVSISDHILSAYHNSIVLKSLRDYRQFVPYTKKELFTVRDFGKKAGVNPTLARKVLYTLTKMGIIEQAGKQGRANIYKRMKKEK